MMKRFGIVGFVLLVLFNIAGIFENFNYINPDDFKQWIESGKAMIIVDIQDKPSFAAHHFAGSIETNAYPVKSEAEKKSIDPAMAEFKKSGNEVIVICPRGGGGAKRCYSYLKEQGVPEEKLHILKGGVEKWPYPQLLVSTK